MEASREPKNPLGLNLDFMFGKGYLWVERQRLSDWLSLESLRMEIPDLQFPFDARGGLDRFRHTRCLVREVEVAISEVGLGDLLREAASEIDGFDELEVRFLEDAAHISFRLSSFGADSHVSFRAALIPPEPARADEVHLSLYDYRAFGPLPYPARLVVHELLTGMLNTDLLRAPGRGASFTVGLAGDIVSFRPLKLLLLHIFPKVGWKLPDLSGVLLESARIRPGAVTIRAVDDDPQTGGVDRRTDHELETSSEGARALAAYEAKELFSHADQALFDGQLRQALSLLSNYRDVYGLHPALVARLFDCLIADGSPANLAEAESIRRQLVDEEPTNLLAASVAPLIAMARRRDQEAREGFEELAGRLRERQQTRDWMLCQLALARLLADDEPEEAAERLRDVLKRDPRHRAALEMLRDIYERIDRRAGLEETLKRLTGVYTDRDQLKNTYLELAQHLMDRQGDLSEARMYLEKVLRLDSTELDALHALGESYVLGGQPLRALKAFGSAARTAETEGRTRLAGDLYFRVGTLWHEELDDPRQALLEYRRALEMTDDEADAGDGPSVDVSQRLIRAAEMCEELNRDEEATKYWSEVIQKLERRVGRQPAFDGEFETDTGDGETVSKERLERAHRHLGRLYVRRDRPSAAASHFRRILELNPGDDEALDWLETHLRRGGRPQDLIELYRRQLEAIDETAARLGVFEKLGDLYGALGLPDDAHEQYRRILETDPGNQQVRKKLIETMAEHGRYAKLRDALNTVLVRTRDHETRYEISVELGEASEALGDLDRATQSYMEAVKLAAGEREPLERLCEVLESLVDKRGTEAEAPIGSSSAGRLLEKMLTRLAEVVPSAAQERELLLRVAMMADERGDTAAAADVRRRAEALAAPAGDDDFEDVDARLDAMLDDIADIQSPSAKGSSKASDDSPTTVDEQVPVPEESSPAFDGDTESSGPAPTRQSMPAVDLPTPSSVGSEDRTKDGGEGDDGAKKTSKSTMLPRPSSVTDNEDGDGKDNEVDVRVQSFRRRFESMKKKPAELPDPDEIERHTSADSRERRAAPDEEIEDEPATMQMPVDQFESLREESSSPEIVEPEEDEASQSEDDNGWSMTFDGSSADKIDVEEDTSPRIHPVETAREEVDRARETDDDRELAVAIDHVLTLDETTETELLEPAERKSLAKEAGELFYYELEDDEAARRHLETVRRIDPDGAGASPEVANALEAIYEESGDVEAQIELLIQRLESTDDAQMKTTYRLLLAQTVWDEEGDRERAGAWLDEVLAQEDDHPAAHRLLADISREHDEWERVVDHLEVVVEDPAGGLDAAESRRELAQTLLRRLEAPKRAVEHFEKVLEAAPGDARALEGIKEARGVLGDWEGYVECLGREIGLLIGEPEPMEPEAMADLDGDAVDTAVRVPASEIIADAAHIVEEHLERLSLGRRLWRTAHGLWPEHVEALERGLALNRRLGASEDLARDLESYASMVLDARDRYDALVEAGDLRATELDEPVAARRLYAEALAIVRDVEEAPDDLGRVRRALEGLDEDTRECDDGGDEVRQE